MRPGNSINSGPETKQRSGERLLAQLRRIQSIGSARHVECIEAVAGERAHGRLADGQRYLAVDRTIWRITAELAASMDRAPIEAGAVDRRAVRQPNRLRHLCEQARGAESPRFGIEVERVDRAGIAMR